MTMSHPSPATLAFLPAYEHLLEARNVPARAKPYYRRWAMSWFTTAGPATPSAARELFFLRV